MADRSIPESGFLKPKMVPSTTSTNLNNRFGFSSKDKLTNLRNTATARRLRARVTQAKDGTAHEQHVAHVQHQQHMQNQFTKNQKSKNPYNT